jgi:hypothetical protein
LLRRNTTNSSSTVVQGLIAVSTNLKGMHATHFQTRTSIDIKTEFRRVSDSKKGARF